MRSHARTHRASLIGRVIVGQTSQLRFEVCTTPLWGRYVSMRNTILLLTLDPIEAQKLVSVRKNRNSPRRFWPTTICRGRGEALGDVRFTAMIIKRLIDVNSVYSIEKPCYRLSFYWIGSHLGSLLFSSSCRWLDQSDCQPNDSLGMTCSLALPEAAVLSAIAALVMATMG